MPSSLPSIPQIFSDRDPLVVAAGLRNFTLACLLATTAFAQQPLSSPSYSAECTILAPAIDRSASPSFDATTVVGGVTSGELSSPGYRSTLVALCPDSSHTSLCGDCDLSGSVTILDALTAAQQASGIAVVPPLALRGCNVASPESSGITVLDALMIAGHVVGRVPGLLCAP